MSYPWSVDTMGGLIPWTGAEQRRFGMRNQTRCEPKVVEVQLAGYWLSSGEILYRMPDFPSMLQSFVWQQYDNPREIPELHRYLNFWNINIDATLHAWRVACAELIKVPAVRNA